MTPPSGSPAGQAIEAARIAERAKDIAAYLRARSYAVSGGRILQEDADFILSLHAQNERLQGAISSAAGALLAGHDDRAYQILGEALMEPKP